MATIDKPTSKPWNQKGINKPWNVHDESGKPFANARRTNGAFYQTLKWKNLRGYHLRSHPLCVYCERKGLTVKGYFVDHITPLRQGGRPLDPMNLQTLCKSCHASKTNKEIANNKRKQL